MRTKRMPVAVACGVVHFHLLLASLALGGELPGESPPGPARLDLTRTGVRFGLWPSAAPKGPAPTLLILSGTIEGTLNDAYMRQSGNELAKRGYLCVSVDLPCHGREQKGDELEGLRGWRQRADQGEDFMGELAGRCRAVLDHLIEVGLTDPNRIAACGTSRGGFSALHLAAAEPRVKCVAAFAPVIDLGVLAEFKGAERQPIVRQLDLLHRTDVFAGRALFLVIGDRDERVGTDQTIRFARQVTAASLESRRPALVDLHVLSEPKGHTTPLGSAERAADWIDRQLRNSSNQHNPSTVGNPNKKAP